MDGVDMKENPATASIVFGDIGDDTWKCAFTTTRPSPDVLQLQGTVNGNTVTILLHREAESKLLKENGKFQWFDPDE
jgi:hypothetical protein